jgi:hypothetical protein
MQPSHPRMFAPPLLALAAVVILSCANTAAITVSPVQTGLRVHEVAQTTTLQGVDPGPATASCPQGELALGGGWTVPAQQAHVYAARLSGNMWQAYVSHPGPVFQPSAVRAGSVILAAPAVTPAIAGITVTAVVECLVGAGSGVSVIPRDASLMVPAFNLVHAGAPVSQEGSCDLYQEKVGMGFDFGSAPTQLELQANIDDAFSPTLPYIDFRFAVANYDGMPHPATLVMYCLAGLSGSAVGYPPITTGPQPHVTLTPVPGGTTKSFSTNCADDPSVTGSVAAVAVGGGWEYMYASPSAGTGGGVLGAGAVYSTRAVLQGYTPVGWQVAVSTAAGAIADFTAEAICLQYPAGSQNK